MKRVVLTDKQLAIVRPVSDRVHERYEREFKSRFKPGTPESRRERRFAAMCAEFALSLELGKPWGAGDPFRADVGTSDESRWTGARSNPQLRLYDPADPDSQDRHKLDSRFWLVTGWPPVMFIWGSLPGREILRLGTKRKSQEGKWSYYVPIDLIAPYPVPTTRPPRLCPSCRQQHPIGTTCAVLQGGRG
jgi:hypothetical protein